MLAGVGTVLHMSQIDEVWGRCWFVVTGLNPTVVEHAQKVGLRWHLALQHLVKLSGS